MNDLESARREPCAGYWLMNSCEFLVVGDVNIDLVFRIPRLPPADGDVEADEYLIEYGGTALNTAVNLKKLGMMVELLICTGRDHWGDKVVSYIEEEGIKATILRSNKNTGLCVVMETPSDRYLVTYRGANVEVDKYHSKVLYEASKFEWVHFSSTSPSLLKETLKALHDQGCTVSYDPGGIQVRKFDKDTLNVLENLDYLFLNNEELHYLEQFEPELSVKRMVVKKGKDGAMYKDSHGLFTAIPSRQIRGRSKGAGDAFDAAFMACMASLHNPDICLKCAVEYATSYLLGGASGEDKFLGSRRSDD